MSPVVSVSPGQTGAFDPSGLPVATVTGAWTLVPSEFSAFMVDATNGAFAATLPKAASWVGAPIVIKAITATANLVTVADSTANIDGASSITLGAAGSGATYLGVSLTSDGAQWRATAVHGPIGVGQLPLSVANVSQVVQQAQVVSDVAAHAIGTGNYNGLPASQVDGVTATNGMIILLTAEPNNVNNGLWVVNSAGAWTRPLGYSTGANAVGTVVYIQDGSTYLGSLWGVIEQTPGAITIDTNGTTWRCLPRNSIDRGFVGAYSIYRPNEIVVLNNNNRVLITAPCQASSSGVISTSNYVLLQHLQVYDPIDYGAAWDGATDDTVAIQNCINAASQQTTGTPYTSAVLQGGIVEYPEGTARVGLQNASAIAAAQHAALDVPPGVWIRGKGENATNIQLLFNANCHVYATHKAVNSSDSNAYRVKITDHRIDGRKNNQGTVLTDCTIIPGYPILASTAGTFPANGTLIQGIGVDSQSVITSGGGTGTVTIGNVGNLLASQLGSALSNSGSITSIPLNGPTYVLAAPLAPGQPVTVGSGGTADTFIVAGSGAAAGASSIPIVSQTPTYNHGIYTAVTGYYASLPLISALQQAPGASTIYCTGTVNTTCALNGTTAITCSSGVLPPNNTVLSGTDIQTGTTLVSGGGTASGVMSLAATGNANPTTVYGLGPTDQYGAVVPWCGIYHETYPYNSASSGDSQFDPSHEFSNLWIYFMQGDSIKIHGRSDVHIRHCKSSFSTGNSYSIDFDTGISDCVSEYAGQNGLENLGHSGDHVSNCKFYNSYGHGLKTNPGATEQTYNGIDLQENCGDGLHLNGSYGIQFSGATNTSGWVQTAGGLPTLATSWIATNAYKDFRTSGGANLLLTGGYVYAVYVAGTSGASVPSWPTTTGTTVADGAVTWVCLGVAGIPANVVLVGATTNCVVTATADYDLAALRIGTASTTKNTVILSHSRVQANGSDLSPDSVTLVGSGNTVILNGVNLTGTLASQTDVAISNPSSGQMLAYSGSTWTNQAVPTGFYADLFGDGSDGALTLDGTTTHVAAGLTLAGSTYTMSRDLFAASLIITSGVTLATVSFRIYCAGTFTNGGTISANGNAGTASGTAGAAINPTTYYGSNAGGAGNTGAGSAGGALGSRNGVGAGGAGGLGSGGAAGGAGSTNGATQSWYFRNPAYVLMGSTLAYQATSILSGAPGGGGGGGDGTNRGGGGGGGGGLVLIFAHVLVNNGTITAIGAVGGTPTTTVGGCGGGGGGGGGMIITYTLTANTGSGSTSVAGGTAGSGVGTGASGSNGGAGSIGNYVLA